METLKIKILENITINDYLNELSLGKHKINYLIDSGKIKLGKNKVKQQEMLKKDDVIYIDITEFEKIDYAPTFNNLNVLYEDDYLMIINKERGVIIYDDKDQNTLANYVRYYYEVNNINRSIRHVHRLDKDTKGCILYTKDLITHSALSKMVENKEVERIYHAVVEGKVKKTGCIDQNISKDRHNNNKMIVNKNGLRAVTHYKLLEYDKVNNQSKVEVILETGRMHQIRVHFASIGHPLIGDAIYNPHYNNEELALISYNIRFIHPITKKLIDIKYQD